MARNYTHKKSSELNRIRREIRTKTIEEVERINSSIKRARKNKLNKLNVDDATMKLCIRLGIAI